MAGRLQLDARRPKVRAAGRSVGDGAVASAARRRAVRRRGGRRAASGATSSSAGASRPLALVDLLYVGARGRGGRGGLLAPMPGKVIALARQARRRVEKGAPLLVLEAMKMEHTISAPREGRSSRLPLCARATRSPKAPSSSTSRRPQTCPTFASSRWARATACKTRRVVATATSSS